MVPLMASNVPVHITHTRPLPRHGDEDVDGFECSLLSCVFR